MHLRMASAIRYPFPTYEPGAKSCWLKELCRKVHDLLSSLLSVGEQAFSVSGADLAAKRCATPAALHLFGDEADREHCTIGVQRARGMARLAPLGVLTSGLLQRGDLRCGQESPLARGPGDPSAHAFSAFGANGVELQCGDLCLCLGARMANGLGCLEIHQVSSKSIQSDYF